MMFFFVCIFDSTIEFFRLLLIRDVLFYVFSALAFFLFGHRTVFGVQCNLLSAEFKYVNFPFWQNEVIISSFIFNWNTLQSRLVFFCRWMFVFLWSQVNFLVFKQKNSLNLLYRPSTFSKATVKYSPLNRNLPVFFRYLEVVLATKNSINVQKQITVGAENISCVISISSEQI